mmetsp:Transcript_15571/g.39468  ORF Transcript_15571/g.39468 Transcript_15571/m.39468 type:complete len:907 (-) Transcript_15571:47-2767(-)
MFDKMFAGFKYNKDNFDWDNKQRIKRELLGLEMRIKQFELYREDIRGLVELTVGRMDMYHMSAALLLAFTLAFMVKGRWHHGELPTWAQGLYYMTCCCGFSYLLLAVWLAMHASVSSHTFGVKLLTRFVRLPIATADELDKARMRIADFEKGGPKTWFRAPAMKSAWGKRDEHIAQQPERELGKTVVGDHLKLYQHLQARWLSFDAYCRVCMSVGMNSTISSCTYFMIGYLQLENQRFSPATQLGSSLAVILILHAVAMGLLRLDIRASDYHSRSWRLVEVATMSFLNIAPVVITAVQIYAGPHQVQQVEDFAWPYMDEDKVYVVAFVPYVLHVLWFCLIWKIISPEITNEGIWLPRRFRAVLYQSDVFAAEGDAEDDDFGESVPEPDRAYENSIRDDLAAIHRYDKPAKDLLDMISTKVQDARLATCAPEVKENVMRICQDLAIRLDETAIQRVLYKWGHVDVKPLLPAEILSELEKHHMTFQSTRQELYSCPHMSFGVPGMGDRCQIIDLEHISNEMQNVQLSYDPRETAVRWVVDGHSKKQHFEDVFIMLAKFREKAHQLIVKRKKEAGALHNDEDETMQRARRELRSVQANIQWLSGQNQMEIEQDIMQRDGSSLTAQLAWRVTKWVTILVICAWACGALACLVVMETWFSKYDFQFPDRHAMGDIATADFETCAGRLVDYRVVSGPELEFETLKVSFPSRSVAIHSMACAGERMVVKTALNYSFELAGGEELRYFRQSPCAGELQNLMRVCGDAGCGFAAVREHGVTACDDVARAELITARPGLAEHTLRGGVDGNISVSWGHEEPSIFVSREGTVPLPTSVDRRQRWHDVIALEAHGQHLVLVEPTEAMVIPVDGGTVRRYELEETPERSWTAACYDGHKLILAGTGTGGPVVAAAVLAL